jgi:hypothetical protein
MRYEDIKEYICDICNYITRLVIQHALLVVGIINGIISKEENIGRKKNE